jgi:hypothetical protein
VIIPRRAAALALALALGLAACSSTPDTPEQRPEDQLFAARQEYRRTLDGLYRSYGGTDVPGNPPPDVPATQDREDENVLGHVVSEADRSYFERQCLAIGRGERPFTLSGKMQRFLDAEENARGCRTAAQLQERIRALEAQVAKP